MGNARRHPQYVFLVKGPWRNGGQCAVTALEPAARRLLAVHIAQHHRVALQGTPSRHVRSQRAFATTALAVNDGYGRNEKSNI